MSNNPIYLISGKKRRTEKKRLANLKSLAKNWWYCHSLEKDMFILYGGSKDEIPMSDKLSQEKYDSIIKEINELESLLSVLSVNKNPSKPLRIEK